MNLHIFYGEINKFSAIDWIDCALWLNKGIWTLWNWVAICFATQRNLELTNKKYKICFWLYVEFKLCACEWNELNETEDKC